MLTTAIAVGMNLAIVGLIDRALLSPPAHVVDPDRLFTLGFGSASGSPEDTGLSGATSFPTFEAIQSGVPDVTFAGLHTVDTTLVVDDRRVMVKARAVTGHYFPMLGARPQIGRTLRPDEERPAGTSPAVLSHSLWKRAFGGDAHVVGRRLTVGTITLEIVGVMPQGFSGHSVERIDLWLPLHTAMQGHPDWDKTTNMATVGISARLAPGLNAAGVAGRMSAVTGMRVLLFPIAGAYVDPEPNRIALWLAGVSLAVLLAGLANGATLSLVRSTRRRRDTSIRVSLGATRGRLARQLLIESAIVASLATCVALVLGYWLDEIVRRVLFPGLVESQGTTGRVVAAAAIGGACTLIVATAAGLLQVPAQVNAAELAGGRRTWRRSAVQHHLLIVQTMLAVVLMIGAGMFTQTYFKNGDAGMGRGARRCAHGLLRARAGSAVCRRSGRSVDVGSRAPAEAAGRRGSDGA